MLGLCNLGSTNTCSLALTADVRFANLPAVLAAVFMTESRLPSFVFMAAEAIVPRDSRLKLVNYRGKPNFRAQRTS